MWVDFRNATAHITWDTSPSRHNMAQWILQLSCPSKPRLRQMGWHTSNANQSVGSDGGLWILEMSTGGQDREEGTTWATENRGCEVLPHDFFSIFGFLLSKCVFSFRHPRTLLEAAKAKQIGIPLKSCYACDSNARQAGQTSSPISPASFWWEASALGSQQSLASSEKQKRSWTWGKTRKIAAKQRKFQLLRNRSLQIWSETLWGQNFTVAWGYLQPRACKQRSVERANKVKGWKKPNRDRSYWTKMEQENHSLRKQ